MSDSAAPDIKAKNRAMWASGDYATVAADLISAFGPTLVAATGIKPGDRVLDIGAGSGNASIPAARTGADVIASDLTPELLEKGRKQAESEGLTLEWRVADAEALPFGDDEFDVAISCVGIMFAPHHHESADELVRVLRPGGSIGLINWTPEGFIGQMFGVMKPYAPPPPPGAQPALLWGSEEHVAALFGDRVTDVVARRQTITIDMFSTAAEFRDFFKSFYGPTISVYSFIGDDAERAASLDRELADLAVRHGVGSGPMEWEYLLYTAKKA
ncbi:ubiquinone/menaquinone biosynthesis C-methylase UbiE [Aeromicrobium panaciterrae]|uniref:Ubiquinone/menaquinone biosynthesis C-methylase UbiE n=1 Tax=Aeromicrobium panaciterrae TaxID=363861 RepID=A0ABU1UQC0_9ACTN|nr:class I SAM-dependent methyltransferase [Aeromicrobium panaciterrae]MDR7087367.1 ubiquinone/menaquinone biosynthesis C-methylase UbiE [Aeromicrobium panaciterrae]